MNSLTPEQVKSAELVRAKTREHKIRLYAWNVAKSAGVDLPRPTE